MGDSGTQKRKAWDHDEWFRAEVGQGMREADDPHVTRIPHEQVAVNWLIQRAELVVLGRILE